MMYMKSKTAQWAESILKEHGLKVTLPRVKVLQIFEEQKTRHLSAEALYQVLLKAEREVSMATLYRVLSQFEAVGLINKLNFESGHSVYELCDGEHHDHLICTQCEQATEFIDEVIEARQKEIAKKFNFKMTGHSLYINGICSKCSENH